MPPRMHSASERDQQVRRLPFVHVWRAPAFYRRERDAPMVRSIQCRGRSCSRSDRRPPATDPLQHRQPAGQRARGAGVPRRLLDERGPRGRAPRRTEERPNLVARLRGRSDGPTLCLLSHVDTVLARPREWEHDPWSGDLADGHVWGRGALDMKSQTAAEVAAASLARAGWRPAAATCSWSSSSTRRPAARAPGGLTRRIRTRCAATCSSTKGAAGILDGGRPLLRRLLRREGRLPLHRHHLRRRRPRVHPEDRRQRAFEDGPAAPALADRQPAFDVTDVPRALLAALGRESRRRRSGRAGAAARAGPGARADDRADVGRELAPTKIRASDKINVIPSKASSPSTAASRRASAATTRARASARSSATTATARVLRRGRRQQSPLDSPLMDAIASWVAEHDPGARVVPTDAARASPTRARSAPRSPSASPTGSSRTATWRSTRPRR